MRREDIDQQLFFHQRHRNIDHRCGDDLLHGVPLVPLLRPDLREPVRPGEPDGRHLVNVQSKVLGACRLGSGGPPDRRRVVQLAPLLAAPGRRLSPWGGMVLIRGQEHLQRELLMAPMLTQPALSAATGAPRSTANSCAVNIHDVNS